MFMFIKVGNEFCEIFCCSCKIERGFMLRIQVFWGVALSNQASIFIVRDRRYQEELNTNTCHKHKCHYLIKGNSHSMKNRSNQVI